jgi:hypothetical protein
MAISRTKRMRKPSAKLSEKPHRNKKWKLNTIIRSITLNNRLSTTIPTPTYKSTTILSQASTAPQEITQEIVTKKGPTEPPPRKSRTKAHRLMERRRPRESKRQLIRMELRMLWRQSRIIMTRRSMSIRLKRGRRCPKPLSRDKLT